MKSSEYNILIEMNKNKYLLSNTRTGNVISLTNNRKIEYEKFINTKIVLNTQFIEYLKSLKFIIDKNLDEFNLIKNNFHKTIENLNKLNITISLTEACNFRCTYCYQAHDTNHSESNIKNTLIDILSKLKISHYKSLNINWFGGEPLLKLDLIEDLYTICKQKTNQYNLNLTQFITTNGSLITNKIFHKLKLMDIFYYQITLDGTENVHNTLRPFKNNKGSYTKVLKGCEIVLEGGGKLVVRINISKLTKDNIEEVLEDLLTIGANKQNTMIHISRAVDHWHEKNTDNNIYYTIEEFSKVWISCLKKVKKHGFIIPNINPLPYNCQFDTGKSIFINHLGKYGSCTSIPTKQPINNYAKFYKKGGDTFYQYKRDDKFFEEECLQCKFLPSCMGGCQYLEAESQEKCIPEKYAFQDLVILNCTE